ncbi:RabGAP/TBC [Exidia glandulosa HHB12029]|uniref:RabGAP/TBC n=1 Tax=Exidia glandulosa HHB12029 TaxID=1314781 RepID=A0A165JHD3_EXIGL|nr:RabGAP/TBC [Exidia glandulosa HHB12029]
MSIRRAESEDPDSFHVRATYAQLEVSGVPRDGIDDGIERTRARLGVSLDDVRNSSGVQQDRGGELDEKELAVLGSLDRYGFYRVDTAHDRLVRVPAAALAKQLSASASTPASSSSPTPAQLALSALPTEASNPETEVRRIAKWGRMLVPKARDQGSNVQMWSVAQRKEPKLRERVYKGIPDRWRTAAWEMFVRRYVGENRMDLATLARDYRDAIDLPSKHDIQIDLDVPRTITGHIMFRTRYGLGQRSLFHVLHAFSLLCDDCGYCQGMGPIAATLLCYYEPERVYAILVQLHNGYNMHAIFSPGFPGLLEAIYVQERMTEKMIPGVWKVFKEQGISTTSYATKWYITLFSNSVPFRTQLRLWDALFLEGHDVLVVLAVGIIWGFRDQLCADKVTFETILSLLSSLFVPEQDDALLRWVSRTMADTKLRGEIRSWREQWRMLVREGKDGGVLL